MVDYDKDFLIFAGLSINGNDELQPAFYYNDLNDFGFGFINYHEDLVRKLFNKRSLDTFIDYIAKGKVANISKGRSNNALANMLKKNVISFKDAKNSGLLIASDYNVWEANQNRCSDDDSDYDPCSDMFDW